MFNKISLVSSLILSIVLVASIFGQADNRLLIKTNLTVTDASGNAYNQLKKGDIKVFENGEEQEITSLEMIDKPLDVLIMIDSSGSFRPIVGEINGLAKDIVKILDEEDSISVVRFVSKDNLSVLVDWTKDRATVNKAFDANFIEPGGTALLDALFLSFNKVNERKKAEPDRSQLIVIISDMEDRDSMKNMKEVVSIMDTEIPIYMIQPVKHLKTTFPVKGSIYRNAVSISRNLAYISGGAAYIVEDKVNRKNLAESVSNLEKELKRNYVLKYRSKNKSFNGKKRELSVVLTDAKRSSEITIAHKKEFILPK